MSAIHRLPRLRLRSQLKDLVYGRPLPEWTYGAMHRLPLLRRALTLQPGVGPKTRRFLEELRAEPPPQPGQFVEARTPDDVRPGRLPVYGPGVSVAPVLSWAELQELLVDEPVLTRDGEQLVQPFSEWFSTVSPLISRRLPPPLADRIDWSAAPFLEGFSPSIWSQDRGAVTQLHQDFCSAIEMTVVGRKKWILYPPCEEERVYARLMFATGFRGALVDPESPDAALRFPRFAEAGPRIEIVSTPGDLLYVPAGWFHHVVYLERSFTVNFLNYVEELRNSECSNLFQASKLLVVRDGKLSTADGA